MRASKSRARKRPAIVVSHQVAQVLNIGIDRVVDIAERREGDIRQLGEALDNYRRHYDRMRAFLLSAKRHLNESTSSNLVDRGVDVINAIDQLLAENTP